ncbi:MAG: hypothetical protein ACR2K6_05045, partial [Solirubrobacterales bacterium]
MDDTQDHGHPLTSWHSVKRLSLLATAAVVSVNVWTGGPLAGLWIGSRLQGDGSLTIGTVIGVVICVAIVELVLALILATLNARYDELIGKPPPPRVQYPWLQSMRKERDKQV